MNPLPSTLLVAALVVVPATAATPEEPAPAAPATHLDLPSTVERVWLGPEWWANRLQDWRLRDGAIECIEASPRWPLRTAHLLTHRIAPGAGHADVAVTLESAAGRRPADGALAGLLLGAGGESVDYRRTAMVHHRPAEDGGVLIAVDADGRLTLRDASASEDAGGLWGIGGALKEGDLPELPLVSRSGDGSSGRDPANRPAVRLHVRIDATGDGGRLLAVVTDPDGAILASLVADLPAHQIDGGLALVSHLGAEGRGHRFRDLELGGDLVRVDPSRRFGPVLGAMHTVSRELDAGKDARQDGHAATAVVNLTAQMGPLGRGDAHTARLELQDADGRWRTAAAASLDPDSYTFRFRVPGHDPRVDAPYRVTYDLTTARGAERTEYRGVIRAEPAADTFTVAAFTGHKTFTGGLKWNADGVWFPQEELAAHVEAHHPDFLFFSGDQVYEGDLTPAIHQPEDTAILDYLYKWYRWCWAFRDLARDLPCVAIPDDHDVYHGNVWGAGGIATTGDGMGQKAQDSGGYKMSARFVNMVHRTQVSHLPPPDDPTPIARGISVYHTRIEYAGVSFAVLADRMFKSSPTVAVPAGECVNGWFLAEGFDAKVGADVPDAVLLGDRQLAFLERWATDWSAGAWYKVVLSQTIFANVATLPAEARNDAVVPSLAYPAPNEYPPDDRIAADADSNGWPRRGRDRALREIRKAFALHIAGDQHLGSTIRYGVDDWNDAGYALCVPSIANTWPRRWFPPAGSGTDPLPGQPPYTGRFEDGFGNRITVFAVSNPAATDVRPVNLHSRMPGYGIVTLDRGSRKATLANWPRHVDPTADGAAPYPGWPVTIAQEEGYGRRAAGWLPAIIVEDMEDPVIRVTHEATGEVVYALRIKGRAFRPKVFAEGTYTVEVGEPGTSRWKRFEQVGMSPAPRGAVEVRVGG